jgi:hypothetical protein
VRALYHGRSDVEPANGHTTIHRRLALSPTTLAIALGERPEVSR